MAAALKRVRQFSAKPAKKLTRALKDIIAVKAYETFAPSFRRSADEGGRYCCAARVAYRSRLCTGAEPLRAGGA
jgi:hypothetical protein